MRIVWRRAQERNLEEQLDYVGERNPRAPNTLAGKIAASVDLLADHPRRGRPGRVAGTFELVVPCTAYVTAAAYRGARGVGATAVGYEIGVGMRHAVVGLVEREPIAQHDLVHRLVALAVRDWRRRPTRSHKGQTDPARSELG